MITTLYFACQILVGLLAKRQLFAADYIYWLASGWHEKYVHLMHAFVILLRLLRTINKWPIYQISCKHKPPPLNNRIFCSFQLISSAV